jgi:hypothetical protein
MWRRTAALLCGALVAGIVIGRAAGPPAAQDNPLPAGKNREIVSGRCVVCHSLETVAQQRQDRAGWEAILDRMISYGAPIPPEDKAIILEYLVTYLGS